MASGLCHSCNNFVHSEKGRLVQSSVRIDEVRKGERMPELSPFVAPSISFLSFCVSLVAYFLSRNSNVSSKRPVLVFVYEHERGWILQNIGNGPALNIVVSRKAVKADGRWFNFVRIPPLSSRAEFPLRYLNHDNDNGLGVTYVDMDNRAYSSTCGNDLTVQSRGKVFDSSKVPITQVWNLQREKDERTL